MHGRKTRRRLRIRTPEEEEEKALLRLGNSMAGLPPGDEGGTATADVPRHHRGSGREGSGGLNSGGGQPRDPNAGGPGGDGARSMPRLELERVDMPGDRPQMDRQALERNKWLAIASAGLSGLGALSDSPGLAKAGEGLSSGFAQASRRRRSAFMNELANYRDRQQAARQENRARERAEAQANYEARLENRRDWREEQQDRAAARRDHNRHMEQIEKEYLEEKEFIEWRRGRPLTEKEKEELWLDKYNAVTDRINALTRRRNTGDSEDRETPEATYRTQTNLARQLSRKTDQLVSAQEELSQMGKTDPNREAQRERIQRLQEERDKILDEFNQVDIQLQNQGQQPAQRQVPDAGSQVPPRPEGGGRSAGAAENSRPSSDETRSSGRSGRGRQTRSPGQSPNQTNRPSNTEPSQGEAQAQPQQLNVQDALGEARSLMSNESMEAALQRVREHIRAGRLTRGQGNTVLDSLGVE